MPDTDREAPQARVDLAEFLDKLSDDTIRLMIADWQQGIDQAEAFLLARADPAPDRVAEGARVDAEDVARLRAANDGVTPSAPALRRRSASASIR